MVSPSNPDRPEPDSQASAEDVEADIARTREDLGHTVDELTRKLDVKAQAQHKVDDVKDKVGQLKPVVPAVAVVLAAAVIAVVIWRRRTS